MPAIAHAAVYVRDLDRTRAFYETYFGATANEGYHNPRTGLRTHFLTFPDGDAQLEIMTRPGFDARPAAERAGWIHLAFKLGTPEAVDALTERLRGDGYPVLNGPRTTGDGYYESVVHDPDGNEIELVA